MRILERNTAENLLILIAGILMFNGIVNIPQIGIYLKEQPFIIIAIAVALLIFKDKIANVIGG